MLEIKVTIDASDRLLAAINAVTGRRPQPRPVETKPAPRPVETKPDIMPQTTEAPAPAPAVEFAPEAPEEITDEQLRVVVKSVRDKSTPAAVREIFAQFGIKTSIECPQERRAELVDRLNKLAS